MNSGDPPSLKDPTFQHTPPFLACFPCTLPVPVPDMRLATGLATFVLVAAVAAREQRDEGGVAGDVKYIRCQACEHFVHALHTAIDNAAQAKPKLGEEDVVGLMKASCQPHTEEGAWLRSLDLVEDDSTRSLVLVAEAEDGPCNRECRTVELACNALLEEGWEGE